MPIRTWSASAGSSSFSFSIASRVRRPARTARSVSSSCAVGAEDRHHRVPDELLHRRTKKLFAEQSAQTQFKGEDELVFCHADTARARCGGGRSAIWSW